MKGTFASMFIRRTILLMAAVWFALGILGAQLVRLTLVQGRELADEAEAKLVRRIWTPTIRGRILDRKGRILAEDLPSFSVSVQYGVLSGEWPRVQAARAARTVLGDRWRELDPAQRDAVAAAYEPAFRQRVEAMKGILSEAAAIDRPRLDGRWAAILDRVGRIRESVLLRRWDDEARARLARGAELTEEAVREIRREIGGEIEEEKGSHILLARIGDEAGFRLLRIQEDTAELPLPATAWTEAASIPAPILPGVAIVNAGDRRYAFDRAHVEIDTSTFPADLRRPGSIAVDVEGVGIHILGWMKSGISAEDVERRAAAMVADPALASRSRTGEGVDLGRYFEGDAVGQAGVEGGMEHLLRGMRGLTTRKLEFGTEDVIAPQPGADIHLSIDIALQARIQAIMDPAAGLAVVQPWHAPDNPTMPEGAPIHGAAVVLDVDSGEILALVSTPTFTRETLARAPERIFEDPAAVPHLNKAIARPYPPGSIAKALVLCEAVERGIVGTGTRIDCTGHLFPDKPDMYRCWIFKRADLNTTHTIQLGGPLDAVQAIMVSCNIFYFTLGQRLGVDGMLGAYTRFGLLRPLGLGVGIEYAGAVGTRGDGADLSIQDAIQMGIGQGPVDWTPLHAADAYATIARGGVRIPPHLSAGPGVTEPEPTGLSPGSVRMAMDGLWAAVNDRRGTGHHITHDGRQQAIFNVPGMTVWGKTGTADAPAVIAPAEGDRAARVIRDGDHSWFVVLAGPASEGRARYAIAVMMEYAGSGGKVSGPIANQILHALRAEGYP